MWNTEYRFLMKIWLVFALSIPFWQKSNSKETKKVLRELHAKVYPTETSKAPKHGFSIPLDTYLSREEFSSIAEAVMGKNSYVSNFIRSEYIEFLFAALKGKQNFQRTSVVPPFISEYLCCTHWISGIRIISLNHKRPMVLYIGNFLEQHGKNPNFNRSLIAKFQQHYEVDFASDAENKLFRLLDMLIKVFRYQKTVKVVIIDTFSTYAFWFAYATAMLCRLLGLPYVTILRGGNLSRRLETSPQSCKSIFTHAATNVSPSIYLEDIFRTRGYNVDYLPNFIDLENYVFKAREVYRPRLLWVRSFHKIYNPTIAVDVLKKLREKHADAVLCMVGPDKDGSLKLVQERASELGVSDSLTITGRLDKKDWIKLAADYDIFINTTDFDNHPVSVIEAMGLGLPLVSTEVGANAGPNEWKFRIVVFGLAGTRLWALERHWKLLRALAQVGLVDSVTLLGKRHEPANERAWQSIARKIGPNVNWRRCFDLSSDEISRELSGQHLGLLANEPDVLTKSGVFAALAEHGVIPVVSTRLKHLANASPTARRCC